MAIYLLNALRIAGVLTAEGTRVTNLSPAVEADFVARGDAVYDGPSSNDLEGLAQAFPATRPYAPRVKQPIRGVRVPTTGTWTTTQTASSPSVTRSSTYPIKCQPGIVPTLISGTSSGAGQYVRVTQTLARPLVDRKQRISVPIFIPDYTKVASVTISASADAFVTTSWSVQYAPEFSGLHMVGLSSRIVQGLAGGQQWTTGNGASAEAALTSLRYQVTLATSVTGSVAFGDPIVSAEDRAQIMVAFDDGEASFMRQVDSSLPWSAFDYAVAKGVPTTSFLISSLIGTAGYLMANDVTRLLAAGHCVCPHGLTSMAALADDAARRADVAANISGLSALGVPDRMLRAMYAYPAGVFEVSAGDTSIVQILRDNNIRTARTAARRASIPLHAGAHRRYHLPILGHYTEVGGGGETNAQTIAKIRDLAETGGLGVVLFHKVVSGAAADTLEIQLTNYMAIIDAIAAWRDAGSMDPVTALTVADQHFPGVGDSNTP